MESELGVVQLPLSSSFLKAICIQSMNSKQMGDEQVELRSFRGWSRLFHTWSCVLERTGFLGFSTK